MLERFFRLLKRNDAYFRVDIIAGLFLIWWIVDIS